MLLLLLLLLLRAAAVSCAGPLLAVHLLRPPDLRIPDRHPDSVSCSKKPQPRRALVLVAVLAPAVALAVVPRWPIPHRASVDTVSS
jgi:hypothetical protein